MYGDYNSYGRQQTGFDNGFGHSSFGHWSNPEYQDMCQNVEELERENAERYKNQNENSTDIDTTLPF